MFVVNSNKLINSNEKYITDSKLPNKNNNIYSKIAPPNTFKKRNPNQILRGSKIFQRNEKSPKSNQILNPYINNSNLNKNNSISKSHIILKDFKINSSFREKTKIIKGNNLFNNNMNNSHNFIITPKKLLFSKITTKGNKIDFNNKYKTQNQNISNKKSKEENNAKIIILNTNKNIKKQNNITNDEIKNKYNLLLNKTRELLSNYQSIVDYYQNKEISNFNHE